MEDKNLVVLNDDVVRIIDEFLNLQCIWCQKKITIFDCKIVSANGFYFCDKYCGQWVI